MVGVFLNDALNVRVRALTSKNLMMILYVTIHLYDWTEDCANFRKVLFVKALELNLGNQK